MLRMQAWRKSQESSGQGSPSGAELHLLYCQHTFKKISLHQKAIQVWCYHHGCVLSGASHQVPNPAHMRGMYCSGPEIGLHDHANQLIGIMMPTGRQVTVAVVFTMLSSDVVFSKGGTLPRVHCKRMMAPGSSLLKLVSNVAHPRLQQGHLACHRQHHKDPQELAASW